MMASNYICRVCEANHNLKKLMKKENDFLLIMLRAFTNVSMTSDISTDSLPKYICVDCEPALQRAFAFRLQYKNTRKKLINRSYFSEDDNNEEVDFQLSQNEDCPSKYDHCDFLCITKEEIDIDDRQFLKHENRVASQPVYNVSANKGSSQKPLKNESHADSGTFFKSENSPTIIKKENISKKEFTCHDCGKIFSESKLYQQHRTKHKNFKPFKCDKCDKSFKISSTLRHHKMLHTNPNSFQCKQCGRSYVEPHKLRAHQRLHAKPDLFKCKLCSKSFVNSTLLNEHLSVHSNPERFKCEFCGRNFNRNTHLKRHKILHDSQIGYRCTECSKCFHRKNEFNMHLKLHANPDLFKCKQCGKLLKKRATLKEHEMMHINPNVFKCEKCGKVYSSSSTLRTHRKQHSSKE